MRWVRNEAHTGRVKYAYKIVARISEEIRLKGICAYIKMHLKEMGYNDSSGLGEGKWQALTYTVS
jgi:hypothetical protein